MSSPCNAEDDIPPPVTLPCGCFLSCSVEDGVKTLQWAPCTPGCPHLAEGIEMSMGRGSKIIYREGP